MTNKFVAIALQEKMRFLNVGCHIGVAGAAIAAVLGSIFIAKRQILWLRQSGRFIVQKGELWRHFSVHQIFALLASLTAVTKT